MLPQTGYPGKQTLTLRLVLRNQYLWKRKGGNRVRQRKKLATPVESSGTGMAFWSCLKLGEGLGLHSPTLASQWIQAALGRDVLLGNISLFGQRPFPGANT